MAIGAVVTLVISGRRRAFRLIDLRSERSLVVAGALLALHFAAWIASLKFASVAISTLLVCSTPVWTEANFSDAIQAAKCSASSAPATTRLRSLRRSIRRNARRRPARRLVGTDGDRGARDAGDLRPPVTSAKRAKIAAAPIASGASATKATAPRWGFMRGAFTPPPRASLTRAPRRP